MRVLVLFLWTTNFNIGTTTEGNIPIPSRMSDKQRQQLLYLHNHYRALETNQCTDTCQVPANIQRVSWNPELEELAQKMVDSCIYKHGELKMGNGNMIGQNLAALPPNTDPKWALKHWYKERIHYSWAQKTCKEQCEHYIQMVFSETEEIGCATAQCGSMANSTYIVCNYHPLWAGSARPYVLADVHCQMCNLHNGSRCSEETNNLCEKCNPAEPGCVPFDLKKCKGREPHIDPSWCMELRKREVCPKVNFNLWDQARDCGLDCGICVAPGMF